MLDLTKTLVNKMIAWIDTGFAYFGNYSKDYSKWIMYIIAGLVLAKMLKVKVNVGGGRK